MSVCVLVGCAGAVWLRAALVERALEQGLTALLAFETWRERAEEPGEAEPASAEAPGLEPERFELVLEEGKPAAKRGRTPDAVSVPEATVLAWIRGRKVPRGRAVAGSPWLPPGISITGISRYGLGLAESDRLVKVDGAPVREPSDVISIVLAAFGRGATQISGEFVRATQNGPRTIRLIVHFPGPKEIQAVLDEQK